MNDSEDRPDLVDTLLRERAGADAQSDLTDAVLARLQRGEAAVQAGRLRWERASLPRRARAWLAAAVLLLGLGVVAAVAFTRRDQEAVAVEPVAPETKGQDPVRQEPEPAPPDRTPPSTSLPFALEVVGPKGGPVVEYEFDLLRVLRRDPAAYTHAGRFRIEPHVYGAKGDPGSNTYRITTLDRLFSDPPPDESIADGDYVVVVTDEMHARTMSEPFAIAKGTLPKVMVRMSAGVAFELQIATVAGKPISGVVVSTQPSRADLGVRTADGKVLHSIGDLFRPNLLSSLRAKSSPSGTVSLRRVTPGKYRLVFEHPDYCTTILDPVEVPLAAPLDTVRMIPGAAVRGTVQGKPEAVAGAKLTLSPKAGTIPSAGLWPMVVLANAKGEFAFASKVPPGEYLLTPLRQPSTEHLLIDAHGVMRDSVELVVEEGQTELQIDPRLRGN